MKAERARLRLRQGQWKRSPREEKDGPLARDQRWRSAVEEEEPRAERQRGQEDGRWRRSDPRGISSGTIRPEEVRKDGARESEPRNHGRRSGSIGGVRGPEGLIGRGTPGQGIAASQPLHGEVLGLPW